jgi:hypothetical protein
MAVAGIRLLFRFHDHVRLRARCRAPFPGHRERQDQVVMLLRKTG